MSPLIKPFILALRIYKGKMGFEAFARYPWSTVWFMRKTLLRELTVVVHALWCTAKERSHAFVCGF